MAMLDLPRGKQARSILESTARINIWEGSVRSGKTVASIIRWLDYAVNGPPGELLMVGKTERTLKRNILDVIEELVGQNDYRYNRGMGEAYIMGRRIYVAGANDERAETKIRGLTLAGAYGDELSLWPESFWTMLLSRLSVRGAQVFGTTNPDGPYHWLKANYLDREDQLNLRSWHFTLDDNPHLDPEYVKDLKREYTGLWHQRYIEGLWVLAEGAVYDMFDEQRHAVDILPSHLGQWVVGVDYGTTNPCVFLLLGTDGRRWYQTKEYYWDAVERGRQKTDAQYADDMIAWLDGLRPRSIYVDPSATSFIAELRRRGLPVAGADNAVLPGIQTVSKLLADDRLFIHRSCTHSLQEFGAYTWDAKAQQRGEDKPLEQHDHAHDARRYALHTTLGRYRAPETGTIALGSAWR